VRAGGNGYYRREESKSMTTANEELIWRGHSSHVVNFWWHAVCWLLFVAVVPLLVSLWKWIENRARVYEITTERVKISQGVFTKRTDELELYRVRDSTVVEPFFYRLFGKGNILLNTTDASTPVVIIEAVPDVNALRDKLRQAIEACRDRKRARISELSGTADLDGDASAQA
jgi:uncharacterized membrane protein YdbT with pleckstrin-like domain